MRIWGCIFALPFYSVGFMVVRWLVPMPTYLTLILSPFITGNLLILLCALWNLHKVNKKLGNTPDCHKFQISKN